MQTYNVVSWKACTKKEVTMASSYLAAWHTYHELLALAENTKTQEQRKYGPLHSWEGLFIKFEKFQLDLEVY